MSNDSTKKTLAVALLVCLVCSVLVSATAVGLKARQRENQRLEKLRNILVAGGIDMSDGDIDGLYNSRIKSLSIRLDSGQQVEQSDEVDLKEALKSSDLHQPLDAAADVAGLGVKPVVLTIYSVQEGDAVSRWILPIAGKGLWSTLYGFIAIDADLKTVRGLTFYEHGETPGLGGEVDNPSWKAQWNGKLAFDDAGTLLLKVIKGKVDAGNAMAQSQIDGLSGSTLTTRGVDNTIRFWLGDNGYGPWFSRQRGEE